MTFAGVRLASLLVLLACGASLGHWQPAHAQSVTEIARMLTEAPSGMERHKAMRFIRAIPVESRGEEVFKALLRELDRQNATLEYRRSMLNRGTPLPDDEGAGEFLLDELEIACQYADDPRVIPHLLPFIGTGGGVRKVLTDFGELSVSGVVGIAAAGPSEISDTYSALMTLRSMLEQKPRFVLSATSRSRIIQVAGLRLEGVQHSVVAHAAMDLAVATKDPALLEQVRKAATDPAVARSRGIKGEAAILFQSNAKAALDNLVAH